MNPIFFVTPIYFYALNKDVNCNNVKHLFSVLILLDNILLWIYLIIFYKKYGVPIRTLKYHHLKISPVSNHVSIDYYMVITKKS